MNRLIKYDLKLDRNFLRTIIILQVIFIGLSFICHGFLSTNYLTNPVFARGIFTISILFFVIINLIYMIKNLGKDFAIKASIFKFSLPISSNKIVWTKICELALFYISNAIFLSIFLWVLRFKISSDIIYFLLLGLIWMAIIGLIIYFFLQIKRFGQGKIYRFYGVLIIIAIFLLGFFICKYFSFVIINGELQHAGPMNYGFIFPFAIGSMGLYKNITALIYYIMALLLVTFLNKENIKNNIDLS